MLLANDWFKMTLHGLKIETNMLLISGQNDTVLPGSRASTEIMVNIGYKRQVFHFMMLLVA